jgi:hypothetical protein
MFLFSFYMLCVAIPFATANENVNLTSPFGLYFSPTTIFASRFNSSDSIEIHKFPISASYKEYYHYAPREHALPPGLENEQPHHDPYYESATYKSLLDLFTLEIAPVTAKLTQESNCREPGKWSSSQSR